LPRCVSSAMTRYLDAARDEGQWEYLYAEAEEDTRRLAARLLGAHAGEIAFTSSTSMGLAIVASGIDWRKGDNVIIADGDFPSNIYPWLNLRERGVEVKFIPRNADGSVTVHDILKIVDKNTRLVSLSSVNYATGYRIDVSEIGKFLHQNGILFCVDAIQSLGAFPIDVEHVDFLACGAHKWLLGPLGIGILYVKKSATSKVRPVLTGWKCVQGSKHYLDYNLCFLESARRYEPGGINITGIMGLQAALGMLLDVGTVRIGATLLSFNFLMRPALQEKGYEVTGGADAHQFSGIISFTTDTKDIAALRRELDDDGFVVSLREGLDGRKYIRASPHFYNTEEEVLRFIARLPDC
jgi:cysteine desulfurase / selenocysteine lyase